MTENLQKTEKPLQNRWLVVIAAVVLELALGAIYAWGIYVPNLVEEGWPDWAQTLPYSSHRPTYQQDAGCRFHGAAERAG